MLVCVVAHVSGVDHQVIPLETGPCQELVVRLAGEGGVRAAGRHAFREEPVGSSMITKTPPVIFPRGKRFPVTAVRRTGGGGRVLGRSRPNEVSECPQKQVGTSLLHPTSVPGMQRGISFSRNVFHKSTWTFTGKSPSDQWAPRIPNLPSEGSLRCCELRPQTWRLWSQDEPSCRSSRKEALLDPTLEGISRLVVRLLQPDI